MKNILKIQITAVTILSLFFGALGFVTAAEPTAASRPPLLVAAEALPSKTLPVLARPVNSGVLPKGKFFLQGANAAGLLPALQIESGYAESLQGAAHITSIPKQTEAPSLALRVAPVHLAVRMSSAESSPSHIWASAAALPGFPAVGQALVPATLLFLVFVETGAGRLKKKTGNSMNSRDSFVFSGFFQTHKVLRC